MESEHCQQKIVHPGPEISAPPSLLAGVWERLAQRDASIDAARSRAELLEALHDARWEVRASAARVLGETREQAALEPLLRAMQDEHRLVRAAAVRALGRLNAPQDQLLRALHDSDWEVREMAVMALAEMKEAIPRALLLAAQRDAHSSVREAATVVLRQQLDLGSRPDAAHQPVGSRLRNGLLHLWLTFTRQLPIISKSIWIGTPLLMLLWCIKTFYFNSDLVDIQRIGLELALVTIVIAAAGSAFIYGSENDASFELTLTTPTSIRLVMLCRFVLVILYNFALAAAASAIVALVHGGNWWEIVQIWLGPMLLISSLTFTLTLLFSSGLALLSGIILELTQSINFTNHFARPELVNVSYWQTTPLTLILAAL
ncbi:MAG: HEAT repeat domain-containing protein, partial [Ktedonobacteraceae bacterium]|nr:HEAT repeat domain-containing protein [Ktedonobacteraceae bacterium]